MNAIYEKEMGPKSFLIGNLDSVQFSCFFEAASLDTIQQFRVFKHRFSNNNKNPTCTFCMLDWWCGYILFLENVQNTEKLFTP